MSKRILAFITIIAYSCLGLIRAQLAVGNWQIYSSIGDPVKVVDTEERVYFVFRVGYFSVQFR